MGSVLTTAPVRTSPLWVKLILGLTGLALGMAPDVLAWLYSILYDVGRWEWYIAFHQNVLDHWWVWPVVPYSAHVLLDMLSHNPEGGWAWWAYVMEPVLGAASFYGLVWTWMPQISVHLEDKK